MAELDIISAEVFACKSDAPQIIWAKDMSPIFEANIIVKLKTDVLAKNIFLISNSKENFTNNFFDLLPNESVEIKIKKETDQDLFSFKKTFKIITLDQTYN